MKNILFSLVLLMTGITYGQEFSGRIIDAETKQGVPFASVYIVNIQIGTIADSAGYFEITTSLPDHLEVKVSAQLYESKLLEISDVDNIVIELSPKHIEFDDIVVSGPTGGLQKQNAYNIDKLKLNDLNSLQSSSLAEAIANINGVQEASFGAGISKPVIRGMQGVRVLTLVNGLRVENQQWGGDHGMAVNQLGVDAVEVIKGPSSLLYGADAFGGVLYLIDAPYSKQNSFEITTHNKYESVTAGSSNSMGLRLSKGKVRFNLHGLYADYADYQLPEGEYAFNTRYGTRGVKSSLGFSNNNWVTHIRYTYSQNITGIPGHAHHEDEEEENVEEHEELHAELQKRALISPAIGSIAHLASIENKFFIGENELSLLIGHTVNRTMEFEETFDEAALDLTLNNTLYNFKYTSKAGEYWKMIYGIQGMYQVNKNAPEAEEQLIPNFEQADNGAYIVSSFTKNDWTVQFGGRYDLRLLYALGADYEGVFGSPNFSVGFVNGNQKRTVRLNIASGYRAPHISELLSDGAHEGAIRYEFGNSELNSERSVQADLGYEFHREHMEFIVNPFYSYIQDYIYLRSADSIFNELPVYYYDHAKNASLYGVDLGIHYHPHFAHWLHLESSYSYIRGEDFKGNSFSLMPQARLNSFLKINLDMQTKFKINEISIQHQFFFDQNKVDVFETSSPSYHLINAGLDMIWELKTPIQIGVGVKNILNTSYINHLSRMKNIGLESPGRNIYVSLKYQIQGNL